MQQQTNLELGSGRVGTLEVNGVGSLGEEHLDGLAGGGVHAVHEVLEQQILVLVDEGVHVVHHITGVVLEAEDVVLEVLVVLEGDTALVVSVAAEALVELLH